MARSYQERGLINHAAGTAANIDASGMKDSVAKVRLQRASGLIDYVTGTAT